MSFNKAGDCFTKIGSPKGNLSLTIVKKNFSCFFKMQTHCCVTEDTISYTHQQHHPTNMSWCC